MRRFLALFLPSLFATAALASDPFSLAEQEREKGNYAIAVPYYQEAFEAGDPVAAHWLGVFYLDGSGVEKNEVTARGYFSIAANKGVEGSMLYLANMHMDGLGATGSCEKAQNWITKALGSEIPESWLIKLQQCRAKHNDGFKQTPESGAV